MWWSFPGHVMIIPRSCDYHVMLVMIIPCPCDSYLVFMWPTDPTFQTIPESKQTIFSWPYSNYNPNLNPNSNPKTVRYIRYSGVMLIIVWILSQSVKLLDIMKWNLPCFFIRAGGTWLVTDMRRGETIFEITPKLQEQIDLGVSTDGSNLSGVSAKCMWHDTDDQSEHGDDSSEPRISEFGKSSSWWEWAKVSLCSVGQQIWKNCGKPQSVVMKARFETRAGILTRIHSCKDCALQSFENTIWFL